jgi:1-acyl-sn-glycerol-3-phosphate acyltransferase
VTTFLDTLSRTALGRSIRRRVIERFQASLHDPERIPREGGALVVGNHTLFGMDALPLTALVIESIDRVPRFLGERNLWRVPGLGQVLTAVGAIPGTPEDAVELLRAGEIVFVYPGGVNDSFKPSSDAYQLQWENRSGFAKVAISAQVPIVPIAATGIDELYEVNRRETKIGRRLLGSSRYDLPLPANLRPRRVPLDYYVLPPIQTTGLSDDDVTVERVRVATHDAIQGVLTEYLGAREGSTA